MGTDENENSAFVRIGMSILLHAGDARNAANDSMKKLLSGRYAEAEELLHEAKQHIQEAHKLQTDVIQKEARLEYEGSEQRCIPLLFIHAQDTIMTIMTEVNLIEQMETMYQKLEEKIDESYQKLS